MNITFQKGYFQVYEVDTKSEMKRKLEKNCKKELILGEVCEQETNFYVLKFYDTDKINPIFGIGIISEGHGLKPGLLIHPTDETVFVGVNRNVYIIRNGLSEVSDIPLESLFYQLIYLSEYELVLVVHELGLCCLSLYGNVVWKLSTDIIENHIINDKMITILVNDKQLSIDLLDGHIISSVK